MYETHDLPLVAYLIYNKQIVKNVDKSNRRAVFSFEETPALERLVKECQAREARVEPNEYQFALKSAKEYLYN